MISSSTAEPKAELYEFRPLRRRHIDPDGQLTLENPIRVLQVLDMQDKISLCRAGDK